MAMPAISNTPINVPDICIPISADTETQPSRGVSPRSLASHQAEDVTAGRTNKPKLSFTRIFASMTTTAVLGGAVIKGLDRISNDVARIVLSMVFNCMASVGCSTFIGQMLGRRNYGKATQEESIGAVLGASAGSIIAIMSSAVANGVETETAKQFTLPIVNAVNGAILGAGLSLRRQMAKFASGADKPTSQGPEVGR